MQEVTNGEIMSFLKAQEAKTDEISSILSGLVKKSDSQEAKTDEMASSLKAQEAKTDEMANILKEVVNRLGSVEGRLGSVETGLESLKVEVEKNTKNIHENGIIMEEMEDDIKLLAEGSNAHFVKIEKAIESIDNTQEQVAENTIKIYALEHNQR